MAARPSDMGLPIFEKTFSSPFAKKLNAVKNAFGRDSIIRDIKSRLQGKPSVISKIESPFRNAAKATVTGGNWAAKKTKAYQRLISRKTPRWVKPIMRAAGKGGMFGGLALGTVAMVGIGIMSGAMNQSQEVVNQRYIQDQRYARNITMMSRLGYSSGTSSMNRFNHTAGLSQALSSNRHGRGGY